MKRFNFKLILLLSQQYFCTVAILINVRLCKIREAAATGIIDLLLSFFFFSKDRHLIKDEYNPLFEVKNDYSFNFHFILTISFTNCSTF